MSTKNLIETKQEIIWHQIIDKFSGAPIPTQIILSVVILAALLALYRIARLVIKNIYKNRRR